MNPLFSGVLPPMNRKAVGSDAPAAAGHRRHTIQSAMKLNRKFS